MYFIPNDFWTAFLRKIHYVALSQVAKTPKFSASIKTAVNSLQCLLILHFFASCKTDKCLVISKKALEGTWVD